MDLEYQEYPRMIFHVEKGSMIVNSDEELEFHLEKGWQKKPIPVSEIDQLRASIAWHRSELVEKTIRLNELCPEEVEKEEIESTSEEEETSEEPKPEKKSRRVRRENIEK